MARVVKELAVVVATYEDRQSGQQKNRYENIGVMMESTDQQGRVNTFLMLNRSFNPAGVPFKPGSDKILISMFDPRPRDGQQGGGAASGQQSGGYGGGAPAASGGAPVGNYADEIPF